ncbi:hypothetical protein [Flavobacterium litorale]|uniref:Uncharacterized protein n=1 Tax=Flavobacterium litorale TaxID=2856519 RepID=A0ABX8VAU3_9FLAO|nr:hypothetical protein [Flavobacterium litorale]QYJ67930.1 hypothetical protein K1I41_10340 [Flavobacterium litorale]
MINLLISKIVAFLLPLVFLTNSTIITPTSLAPSIESSLNITNYQDSYTYNAEAHYVNTLKDGCDTMMISIYSTNNNTGQRKLVHWAVVKVGIGCGDETGQVVISNTYFGTKSLPDYLVEDKKPDGKPIIPFLKEHPEVYKEYVLQREKLQR